MSKNKKMTDQLAALRKQAVNDEPEPQHSSRRPPPAGAVGNNSRRPLTGERQRQAVNLTPEAREALRILQSFLVAECGTGSISVSTAVCVALEVAAESIPAKKKTMLRVHETITRTDKRRQENREKRSA